VTIRNGQSTFRSRQSEAAGGLSLSPAGLRPWRDESGVILIALLWILAALSVIALSFSRESRVEVAAARNAQSLEDSYFVARAGIATTIYQLLQKRYTPVLQRAGLQDTPDPLDLGIVTGSLGGGAYRVDIQDESGKVAVNTVSEEFLRNLVEAVGIPKPDSDIITDSILDWRDQDSAHRLNGAEDDYYQQLNPPYKAKNGRIETIEELLLVRGVTPEYFYGHPEKVNGVVTYKYGLSRYLTPYSNSPQAQVNINFAALPVLLAVPGMPPEAAQAIFDRRHVKPFKATADISHDLGVSLSTTTLPYLTVNQTTTYTLTAAARAANSKALRVIRTVVNLQFAANKPYRTIYWNENVPDYEGITP
jgi:general secretion pathway protein K